MHSNVTGRARVTRRQGETMVIHEHMEEEGEKQEEEQEKEEVEEVEE